jgi:hypothetical protein
MTIILTGVQSTAKAEASSGILVLTESPDYVAVLEVSPTRVMPRRVTRNKTTHAFEDGRFRTKKLSAPKYEVELQWDYMTQEDRETIFDWYNDPNKAYGIARSFYWYNPRSNALNIARFLGPLTTVYEAGQLRSIDKIPMKIIPV